jgi:hypothetical protein
MVGQNPQACSVMLSLDANPALFSGDPNGVFTYEDPILAIAALWHRKGTQAAASMGVAGEGISKWSIFNWMLTGVNAWLNRSKSEYVSLAGMTPYSNILLDKLHLRIAVVGDAGYNGSAQARVLRYIRERHQETPFDFIIHLGDTYSDGSQYQPHGYLELELKED